MFSSESSTAAPATFSSRCSTEAVPGIGSMTSARAKSQASATWAGAAPTRLAMASSGEPAQVALAWL